MPAALNDDYTSYPEAIKETFPYIAALRFIRDFPCVSITEFMLDYEEKGSWPYPLI